MHLPCPSSPAQTEPPFFPAHAYVGDLQRAGLLHVLDGRRLEQRVQSLHLLLRHLGVESELQARLAHPPHHLRQQLLTLGLWKPALESKAINSLFFKHECLLGCFVLYLINCCVVCGLGAEDMD